MAKNSTQVEKNKRHSPNTWISLSNDILQEVLRIEKSIKRLDVPSFENRFKDIFLKVQALFSQADIDQQTSILLDHVPLRTFQRELIRNLLRLIITSRTLATSWETKTLKDHVLILCHDFRASLRSLVRERKEIERKIIENNFKPSIENNNRKTSVKRIENKIIHTDNISEEKSIIPDVQVRFELEPDIINASSQPKSISIQLLSTEKFKEKKLEDIDSALHSPCSPNPDIKKCLDFSMQFNSTIASVINSDSLKYSIKVDSFCQPREEKTSFLNCKTFYKQVNTEEGNGLESNTGLKMLEDSNNQENQKLNSFSVEANNVTKNTDKRNLCPRSELNCNQNSFILVEKSFKQCDCGIIGGHCSICILLDSGCGSDSDSIDKIQESTEGIDKSNSFSNSSEENINKSGFQSCVSDSNYTSPHDAESPYEDYSILYDIQENKAFDNQLENYTSFNDFEEDLLSESPVNDVDLSRFLHEAQRTLDDIKNKVTNASLTDKEVDLIDSSKKDSAQLSKSQVSLEVPSNFLVLVNHSISPKFYPSPTAVFFTEDKLVDVPSSPIHDKLSINETHADSSDKYQAESKSYKSESSASSFSFNQLAHTPNRISMLPNFTTAQLKGDAEEDNLPLNDSESIASTIGGASICSSLIMDDKRNNRKSISLSQKSPSFRCNSALAVSTVRLFNDDTESVSSLYDAFSGKKDFFNFRKSLPVWKRRQSGVSTLNGSENETRFFESDESILFTKNSLSMEIKDDEEEIIVRRQIKKSMRIRSKAMKKGKPLPPHPVNICDVSLCRKVLGSLIDNYSFQPIVHMEGLFILAQNITIQKVEFIEALEDMIRSMSTLFAVLDSLGIPNFKKEVGIHDSSLRFDILREFTLRKDTLYSDLDDVIGFTEYFDIQNSFELLQNLSIILISMIKEYEGLLLISKYVLNHPKFIKIFTDSLICFDSLYYDDVFDNELVHLQETIKDLFSHSHLRREQEEQTKYPEKMSEKIQRALDETEERQRRSSMARLSLRDKVDISDEQITYCLMPGVQNLSTSLSRKSSRDTSISFRSNQKPLSLFSLDNSSKYPTPSRISMNYSMISKYNEGPNPIHRNSKVYPKNNISKKSSVASLLAPIATRAIFESNLHLPLDPPRMDLTKIQFDKNTRNITGSQFSPNQSEHISLMENDSSFKEEMNYSGIFSEFNLLNKSNSEHVSLSNLRCLDSPIKQASNSPIKDHSFSISLHSSSNSDFLVAIEPDNVISRNSISFNAEPIVNFSFNDSDGELIIGNVISHPVVLTKDPSDCHILTTNLDIGNNQSDFVTTRLDFSNSFIPQNLQLVQPELVSFTSKYSNEQVDGSYISSLIFMNDEEFDDENHSSESTNSTLLSNQCESIEIPKENASVSEKSSLASSNDVSNISNSGLVSDLEKLNSLTLSDNKVGLDESQTLKDIVSPSAKKIPSISPIYQETKIDELSEVIGTISRSNSSLLSNLPANSAAFSDFSFSIEVDQDYSISRRTSFDVNNTTYDPSFLKESNASSNTSCDEDSLKIFGAPVLSSMNPLETCSTLGYKSPRNSMMTLNSIATGSMGSLLKEEEIISRFGFYEIPHDLEKNELITDFHYELNTTECRSNSRVSINGSIDIQSENTKYPQFSETSNSQDLYEQPRRLEITNPFSDPHIIAYNGTSQIGPNNSGTWHNSEPEDSNKNLSEYTNILFESPKPLDTKLINITCFTCTCKKTHVCDPVTDSTSKIQSQNILREPERISVASCSIDIKSNVVVDLSSKSVSCHLDNINNPTIEAETGLNQSRSKSKSLSPELTHNTSISSEKPSTILFTNDSFKATSNTKDSTESSSPKQDVLYLPFNSSSHNLTFSNTLSLSNDRDDSLIFLKNRLTSLRRHTISGAIESEFNLQYNLPRPLNSQAKCHSTRILPSQLNDMFSADNNKSLEYSLKLPNQPKVQKLGSSIAESDDFSSFPKVSETKLNDDAPNKKNMRPKSCGDFEGLYGFSSPMRLRSMSPNMSINKPMNKMKKILVGVKNRQVFGRTFLTYVAPHGVEFLANTSVPLNPHYIRREKEKTSKTSRKKSRFDPHTSYGPDSGSLNFSTYSDDGTSVLGSRKQSQDSNSVLDSRKQSLDSNSILDSRKQSHDGLKASASTQVSLNDSSSTSSGLDKKESENEADKDFINKSQTKNRRLSKFGFTDEINIPWFLGYDYSSNDILIKDGLILNATKEALIERLTLHDEAIDSKFMETFLLTFRSFSNASEFLDLLIKRYNNLPPPELTSDELTVWVAKKQTSIRIRVNNILKTWLESYFYESDDGGCLERLISFCSCDMMETMPSAAKRILAIAGEYFEKFKLESSNAKLTKSKTMDLMAAAAIAKLPNKPPPTPLIPRWIANSLIADLPFRIIDLNPLEVARQLTIMDYRAYSLIRPHELIGLEFSKKSSTSVEHVRSMTEATNEITSLLCDCILKERDIKKRCNLIKYFITLGVHLLELKNFNSLMPIVGALNSSMIARLKKTWGLLPHKFQSNFANLRKATDHTKNYAVYRNVLKMSMPPCLPFLGIYLTDLTFTDEGNAAFKGDDKHKKQVNFAKYYRTVAIVQEIQKFQIPYNLIEVRELQTRLKSWMKTSNAAWDEDSFYNTSLQLEPRNSNQPALTVRSRSQTTDTFVKISNPSLVSQAYF